jgi:hypothetical protein
MPPAATRRARTARPVEDARPVDELGAAFGIEEPPRVKARRQARRIQSATADPKVRLPENERAVEVADGELSAPLAGHYFRLQESIGLMPLMEWAAATAEVDPDNQVQLAGLFNLLKDLVDPEDWAEFRKVSREAKCNDEDFVKFVNAAMEAIAARPTAAPATS